MVQVVPLLSPPCDETQYLQTQRFKSAPRLLRCPNFHLESIKAMAKYKEPEFTVTDKRRRYEEDGGQSEQETSTPEPVVETPPSPASAEKTSGYVDQQFTSDPASATAPPPPSQADQDAQ